MPPAAIATTLVSGPLAVITLTGWTRGVVVPSPSRPDSLVPHAQTLPSDFRARACVAPAEIATTSVTGDESAFSTGTGYSREIVVPSPIWPDEFSPHPQRLRSARMAN